MSYTEKVLDDVAYSAALSTPMPFGLKIVHTEERFGDEHDSHRSVVFKDVTGGGLHRFNYRFNFAMRDVEVMSEAVEVFERPLAGVEYVTAAEVQP